MFNKAIVRKVGPEIKNGLTTQSSGQPQWENALIQHDNYCNTLRSLGLELFVLDSDPKLADGVFVEDTAIVTKEQAVITRPGAESRRGETKSVKKAIEKFYPDLKIISEPGVIDGGDVLQVDKDIFVGLTSRTNQEGVLQLSGFLSPFGYRVNPVTVSGMLHLKSGISYLGNDTILVVKELADIELFSAYKKIVVPENEEYAANSINVNGKILIPKGYKKTRDMLDKHGFSVIELDVSEFKKVDGGLSCLSVRF